MRKLFMLAVAAALVLPTASRAQFTLGARLGFAPAMGDAAKNQPMSDGVKSQVPIQLDGLYRFTPEFAAGVYFSYGFAQLASAVKDGCDASGVSCSASVTRLGLEGTYSLTTVSPTFVPWFGAGIGYEWLTQKASFGGVSASADATGFEFLNLQLGGDYKVSNQFYVGPYLLLSIGQYSEVAGNSITDKGIHEWLSFGVRGKFDL
jgi:outer membrane protein W